MTNSKGNKFGLFRSYILLFGGLLTIGWEVLFENSERPTIIVAALLMMGISVPLNLDDKAKGLAAALRAVPEPASPPPVVTLPVVISPPTQQIVPARSLYQEALAREAEAHAATEAARLKEGGTS